MQRSPWLVSSEGRGPHGRCPLTPAVDGSTVKGLRVHERRFQPRGCLVCRLLHEHGVSRRNRRHGGHDKIRCFGAGDGRGRGHERAKALTCPPRRQGPKGRCRCRAETLDWVHAVCTRRTSRLAGGAFECSGYRAATFGWSGRVSSEGRQSRRCQSGACFRRVAGSPGALGGLRFATEARVWVW